MNSTVRGVPRTTRKLRWRVQLCKWTSECKVYRLLVGIDKDKLISAFPGRLLLQQACNTTRQSQARQKDGSARGREAPFLTGSRPSQRHTNRKHHCTTTS